MEYDFDRIIDRHGSGAMKLDCLESIFGKDDLLPMWIADMDFAVCPEIVEALKKRLEHPVLGYSAPSCGYWQSIIGWLSHRHGFNVTREELSFIPGVVKGLAFAVNHFTREGDGIVIQPPVYHPFRMVIEGNRRIVLNNPLVRSGDSYTMDFAHLEQLFADKHPRMMILCNPHNPAGIQWDAGTLKRLASLCRKYGVIVVSDEIHGDLMLYGRKHIPFASVSDDAAMISVSLGAPSKTFNIPGLVSSWVIVKNPGLRVPFYHWMEINGFSEPSFMATIGTEAAYRHGEEWLDKLLEYIEGNIATVEEYIATRMPMLKPMRPQASFLIWLDCSSLGLEQSELVDLFVNKARLALNDGTMFGKEGEGYMRLNVATPRKVVIEALDRLYNAIRSLQNQA